MPKMPNGDWVGEDLRDPVKQVLALWPELCRWTQAAVTKWKNRLPNTVPGIAPGSTVDLREPLGNMAKVVAAVQALEDATPNIPNIPDGAGALALRLWEMQARAEQLTDEECAVFLADLESLTSRSV